MKDPTYAPIYAALYPQLTAIARKHGYAMAVHGTLARDMDLICVPWMDHASKPDDVIDEIVNSFHIVRVGGLTRHAHNRVVQTISVGHGECFLDLSFMYRWNTIDEVDGMQRSELAVWNLIDFCGKNPVEIKAVDQRSWEHLMVYIPKETLLKGLEFKMKHSDDPDKLQKEITRITGKQPDTLASVKEAELNGGQPIVQGESHKVFQRVGDPIPDPSNQKENNT
jgi:hypothetical protein